MPRRSRSVGKADETDVEDGPDAPFGFDVVGEDGRRVFRSLPESDARNEAARVSSVTGETLKVVPAEVDSPAVAGPAPDPEFPPIAEQLAEQPVEPADEDQDD